MGKLNKLHVLLIFTTLINLLGISFVRYKANAIDKQIRSIKNDSLVLKQELQSLSFKFNQLSSVERIVLEKEAKFGEALPINPISLNE